jgi:hypothetical protein
MERTTRCSRAGWVLSSVARVRSFRMLRWTQLIFTRFISLLHGRGICMKPTTRRSTTCFMLCVNPNSIGFRQRTWLVGFGCSWRMLTLGTDRFRLGCMRLTGESTIISLISSVSQLTRCFNGSRFLWTTWGPMWPCSRTMIMTELWSSCTRWIEPFRTEMSRPSWSLKSMRLW